MCQEDLRGRERRARGLAEGTIPWHESNPENAGARSCRVLLLRSDGIIGWRGNGLSSGDLDRASLDYKVTATLLKESGMTKHLFSLLIAAFVSLYGPFTTAGDLSGKWVMKIFSGNKQVGETQLNLLQNGSELILTTKAVSNKDLLGHGWGKLTTTEKGSETVATPAILVELTRVDGVGNYVSKYIGVIDAGTKINGYFVDVNGRRGIFTLEKR
jgi:hypothetical protein